MSNYYRKISFLHSKKKLTNSLSFVYNLENWENCHISEYVYKDLKRRLYKYMKNVLIVDDAAFMRLMLKTMLEKNSFNVVGEAENGALGVIKFKELSPDIVTMDITMPILDGLQALKEIRKINPNANVVMISAMGQEHLVRDAVISGAKGFVVKPFKEEAIVKALNKIV